jgi:hypothetical protein
MMLGNPGPGVVRVVVVDLNVTVVLVDSVAVVAIVDVVVAALANNATSPLPDRPTAINMSPFRQNATATPFCRAGRKRGGSRRSPPSG